MRCSICKKEIFYNIRFKDLFEFNFVCKECNKLLKAKETIIPIDYSKLIHFYYFLVNDEYSKEVDKKINKEIFDIINKRRKETLYFYDENFIKYYKYLNFNQDIILINKTYIELENILDENDL